MSTNALTVQVNQPSTSTITATGGNDYTLNGILYTQSGTYTQTTTNAAGCDSTANLNLTIRYSTVSFDIWNKALEKLQKINNKIYVGQAVTHRLNKNKYRYFGYEGRFKDHISEAINNTKKKIGRAHV